MVLVSALSQVCEASAYVSEPNGLTRYAVRWWRRFGRSLAPAELLALFSLKPDETRTAHPLESRLNKLTRLEPLDSNTAVLLPVIGKANHACSPSAMLSWEYKAEENERTCREARPSISRSLHVRAWVITATSERPTGALS